MGVIAMAMGEVSTYDVLNQNIRKLDTKPTPASQNTDPKLTYCGLHCFQVVGEFQGYPITLTLERQGLWQWQIVNIGFVE